MKKPPQSPLNQKHRDDHLVKQNHHEKSFLVHLIDAVKNFFSSSEAKSKGDSPQGGEANGIRNSSQITSSSSGFSSGSKNERSSSSKQPNSFSTSESSSGEVYGSLNFTLEDIKIATKNFSMDNIIGDGGFGKVYKGQLKDGTIVAIKRAKKDLCDKRAVQEFKSEILVFSKIEHLNLVRFYGYLDHPDEKIIVVEYVGNGTLFHHLHRNRESRLEISERLDIVIDVAHAITYLHSYTDPPIIHRDIKALNILITENLRAKVADFGLARLVPEGSDVTHISTQVKGTAGYLDPEYMQTYQLTEKSDVYSFGVLLIELVTGRHPLEPKRGVKERITTKWALSKLRDDMPVLAMDPRLNRNPISIQAVKKVLEIAQKCVGPIRKSRPSMEECVEGLWAIRKELKEGAQSLNLSSQRSVGLLEIDARERRKVSLGIERETFRFQSE